MRILIIKMSSYGDIVQSFGVVAYLKTHFPEITIDWVSETKFSSLVKSCEYVDNVITLNSKNLKNELQAFSNQIRSKEYDIVLDLQGNCKSALATFLSKAKKKLGYSWKTLPEWPNGLVTNTKVSVDLSESIYSQYLKFVRHLFNDANDLSLPRILLKMTDSEKKLFEEYIPYIQKNSFFVSFASRWDNKQLSKNQLVEVLKNIEKKKPSQFVFAYLGEEEKKVAQDVVKHFSNTLFLGSLPLSVLQHLMVRMKGLIAIDSTLLHLGAIAKVPTFSFFGPSSSSVYGPKGMIHQSVQGKCPFKEKFEKRCQWLRTCKNAPCLKKIEQNLYEKDLEKWLETIETSMQ